MTSIGETALVRNLFYLSESQAVTSHNLANVTSSGFKRRIAVPEPSGERFDDFLGKALPLTSFKQHIDWRPGSFINTTDGSKFAMRDPKAFLQIRLQSGQIAYTRNGDLMIDDNNQLKTRSGHTVLDDVGEPLAINAGGGGGGTPSMAELRIAPNGELEIGQGSVGRLRVVSIEDLSKLSPAGNGNYIYTGTDQPALAQTNSVTQRFVEQGNTESVTEMVQMISNQRGFQSTMSALRTLGKIKESYVNAFTR